MTTLKTDFADGEILYAGAITDTDKLNGITTQINGNIIHRKAYSVATARVGVGTYNSITLLAPINSIITSLYVSAKSKSSDSGVDVNANIKFTGTNLGTVYLSDLNGFNNQQANNYFNLQYSTTSKSIFSTRSTGGQYFAWSCNDTLKILDNSTTIELNIVNSEATISDYIIKIMYVENYIED